MRSTFGRFACKECSLYLKYLLHMLAFIALTLDLRSSLLTLSHVQASLHGFRLHAALRSQYRSHCAQMS